MSTFIIQDGESDLELLKAVKQLNTWSGGKISLRQIVLETEDETCAQLLRVMVHKGATTAGTADVEAMTLGPLTIQLHGVDKPISGKRRQCKHCGKDFEYTGKGLRLYCDRRGCMLERKAQYQRSLHKHPEKREAIEARPLAVEAE